MAVLQLVAQAVQRPQIVTRVQAFRIPVAVVAVVAQQAERLAQTQETVAVMLQGQTQLLIVAAVAVAVAITITVATAVAVK